MIQTCRLVALYQPEKILIVLTADIRARYAATLETAHVDANTVKIVLPIPRNQGLQVRYRDNYHQFYTCFMSPSKLKYNRFILPYIHPSDCGPLWSKSDDFHCRSNCVNYNTTCVHDFHSREPKCFCTLNDIKSNNLF